jgi:hypothetical protein
LTDNNENIDINTEDTPDNSGDNKKKIIKKEIKEKPDSNIEGSEIHIPVKRGRPKKIKEEHIIEEQKEEIKEEEIIEQKEIIPEEKNEIQNIEEEVIPEISIIPEENSEIETEGIPVPETETPNEETKSGEEIKDELKEDATVEKVEKDSNYHISLVDENLLRVRVVTDKSVSIDCSVKDKYSHSDGSNETQANKIFIHPKDKPQEVEIIVSIGSGGATIIKDTNVANSTEIKPEISVTEKPKLTPNPLVANLIQKFSPKVQEELPPALTPQEKLEQKLGPKNPWRIYKELMHRNLIIGLAGAVLVYIIFVVTFYSVAARKNNNSDVVDSPRLIVMQDLPENQFLQQNIQDPNKPPEEEKVESDDGANTNKIPPITTKKISKPPRVIGPPKQKVDTNTLADKELDSLRKINKNITSNGKLPGDSTKISVGNYPVPDSIMKGLKDNEVGLIGRFPPNWKQIDSREVDINKKEFTGVILVDTSVKKKEEALNMSVQIDKNSEYWKQYSFKNVFAEDSLKNIIYSIDPKQEGDQTYYRFYISGMAYNIYIAAFINNEHFEKHKAEIEQVVRTIRIKKPETPPGK